MHWVIILCEGKQIWDQERSSWYPKSWILLLTIKVCCLVWWCGINEKESRLLTRRIFFTVWIQTFCIKWAWCISMVPLTSFSHFVFVPVKKHSGVGCFFGKRNNNWRNFSVLGSVYFSFLFASFYNDFLIPPRMLDMLDRM